MLYSILFPSIVVLSLAAIIVFLAKKAPAIKDNSQEDRENSLSVVEENTTVLKKTGFFIQNSLGIKLKNGAIFLLKKLGQLLKKIGVKVWELIRGLFKKNKKDLEEQKNEMKQKEVLEKVEDYSFSKKEKKTTKYQSENIEDMEAERPIRPMISDKVATPANKAEIRDRLEEALVERIAINPKDVEAYERLGEYYLEINNVNDAEECFKQVIKLDPTNRKVKFKIQRIQREAIK